MKTYITTITPDRAKALLSTNTTNRRVKASNVRRLAKAMSQGEWKLNGQPIIFSNDDTLLDGQHRLEACIISGVTFETLYIEGVDGSFQKTMDQGVSRSLGDVLGIEGYSDQNAVAALARKIVQFERTGFGHAIFAGHSIATPDDVLDAAEKIGDCSRYIQSARRISKFIRINPSCIGFLMWYFDKLDANDSNIFWEKLEHGYGLTPGDPVAALRAYALDPLRVRTHTTSAAPVFDSALVIKAWNKFRTNESAMRIIWKKNEAFPKAI